MEDKIEYTITPSQLLSEQGVKFSQKGNWFSCQYCPFCQGGQTKQVYTFGVRVDDYNYNCLRTTCGAAGSFWSLLQHFGYDPKEYVKRKEFSYKSSEKKKSSKRFIYRRNG
jgi:hypothetical protein